MTTEDIIETKEEISIEDELRNAMTEAATETPKEVSKEPQTPAEGIIEKPENEPAEEKAPKEPPPVALSGAIKAKWSELPEDVRAEWSKRENDIHQMMTRHDGELRLGREMKEVVSPYMAIIQAEGGTPAGAVKDLLNTAYVLRTGSQQQKSHVLRQVAEQYGVDLGQTTQPQEQIHPIIAQMQQELQMLRQQANPEVIEKRLQEKMENANIQSEVNAFAVNPANKHFEQVKAFMAPLLASGQAKDLQEAYDMACYANPAIRSTLIQQQTADLEAKRKAEIKAKKQASSSVTGSPDFTSPMARTPNKSLEDDLRDQMREARGVIQ
jgi:hypothetical protein